MSKRLNFFQNSTPYFLAAGMLLLSFKAFADISIYTEDSMKNGNHIVARFSFSPELTQGEEAIVLIEGNKAMELSVNNGSVKILQSRFIFEKNSELQVIRKVSGESKEEKSKQVTITKKGTLSKEAGRIEANTSTLSYYKKEDGEFMVASLSAQGFTNSISLDGKDFSVVVKGSRYVSKGPTITITGSFAETLILRDAESKKDDAIAQGEVVKTGQLMWMRCSVGQTWTGTTCIGKPKGFERSDAMNQKLDYAGFSDWRPPSVQELNSLVRCPAGRSPLDSDNHGKCLGDRGKMGNEIWRNAYGEMNYQGIKTTALIDLHQFPGTLLADYWTYETTEGWFNYVSFIDGESAGGQNNRAFTRGGVFLRMVRDDFSDKVQVPESDFDIRVKVSAKKSDPSSLKHDIGIMQFDSVDTSNQIHMSYAISPKAQKANFKNRNIVLVLNVVIDKQVDIAAFGIGVSQSQPEFKTIKIPLKKANSYIAKGTQQLFDIQTFSKVMGASMQVSNVKPKVSLKAIYYE